MVGVRGAEESWNKRRGGARGRDLDWKVGLPGYHVWQWFKKASSGGLESLIAPQRRSKGVKDAGRVVSEGLEGVGGVVGGGGSGWGLDGVVGVGVGVGEGVGRSLGAEGASCSGVGQEVLVSRRFDECNGVEVPSGVRAVLEASAAAAENASLGDAAVLGVLESGLEGLVNGTGNGSTQLVALEAVLEAAATAAGVPLSLPPLGVTVDPAVAVAALEVALEAAPPAVVRAALEAVNCSSVASSESQCVCPYDFRGSRCERGRRFQCVVRHAEEEWARCFAGLSKAARQGWRGARESTVGDPPCVFARSSETVEWKITVQCAFSPLSRPPFPTCNGTQLDTEEARNASREEHCVEDSFQYVFGSSIALALSHDPALALRVRVYDLDRLGDASFSLRLPLEPNATSSDPANSHPPHSVPSSASLWAWGSGDVGSKSGWEATVALPMARLPQRLFPAGRLFAEAALEWDVDKLDQDGDGAVSPREAVENTDTDGPWLKPLWYGERNVLRLTIDRPLPPEPRAAAQIPAVAVLLPALVLLVAAIVTVLWSRRASPEK